MNDIHNTSNYKKILKIGKWTLLGLFFVVLLVSGGLFLMRDKIIGIVVSEVNKNLTAPVNVGDLSLTFWATFPSLSVDFEDVYIHDALPNATQTDTLFAAQKVRLKLNPFQLLQKKYQVKEIEIFEGKGLVKVWENGDVNYLIVAKDKSSDSKSNFHFTLDKVKFHDFTVGYWDQKLQQNHRLCLNKAVFNGDFTHQKTILQLEADSRILYINSDGITLVKNTPAQLNFALQMDLDNNTLTIPTTPITIAELPFVFGLTSATNQLTFSLASNGIKLTDLATRLNHQSTQQIKEFKGSGSLNFSCNYMQIGNQKPIIKANFGIKNGNIIEPKMNLPMSQINLAGSFSNDNARGGEILELSTISFVTRTGPFSGKLKITDFANPRYVGEAKGTIDLSVLHTIFPLPTVAHVAGTVQVGGDFDVQTNQQTIEINSCAANARFNNVQFQQIDDKRFYDHINGALSFENKIAKIDDVRLTVGKSDLGLSGQLQNLEAYLNHKEKLAVAMKITSAYLSVQDFASTSKAQEIANGRNFILPNDIDGDVRLMANTLVYEKHTFKQLSTDLKIANRNLYFDHLKVQNADANINGVVAIAENSPEIFTIQTVAHTDRLAFKPLFKEWENFQQEVITSEQINGYATVDLNFSAPFDLRSGINKNKIVATVNLKVQEGRLTNVQTFKQLTKSLNDSKTTRLILKQNNISNFEKELLDLKIANFENILHIENGRISIPKMTIASNALNLELTGTHDFDNQIDYRFNFNFRDIKKQTQTTEFGVIHDDGTGLQLFVHMFGPMDNPTIKWDQEAQKMLVKQNIEIEKQTTKAMLKAELGLFKKDTTIAVYLPKQVKKEQLYVTFAENKNDPEPEIVKKEFKIIKTFQKWKQDAEKERTGKNVVEEFK